MYLCSLLHQLSSLCLSSGGMSPWFLKHPTHKFPYITTIIYYISRAVVFLPQIAYKSLKTALVTPPGWFPSIRLVWSFPCSALGWPWAGDNLGTMGGNPLPGVVPCPQHCCGKCNWTSLHLSGAWSFEDTLILLGSLRIRNSDYLHTMWSGLRSF